MYHCIDTYRAYISLFAHICVSAWDSLFYCYILRWKRFFDGWLSFTGPILRVQYEDLQSNLDDELHKIADFLNLAVSDESILHTLKHSEGKFHREHHTYNFTEIYQGEKQMWLDNAIGYTNMKLAAKFDKVACKRRQ